MAKIILQPTANKTAYRHYVKTILNPVSIDVIKEYVDLDTYNRISQQYPGGFVYVWGVKDGKNAVNKKKWEKIERGDVTLFSRKGGIFASAVTTMTFHNERLSQELWGIDKDGTTWENIYLVEDVKKINIPYAILNPLLGYKVNMVIQGFSVLSREQSEKLNYKFDLFSREICEEIPEGEYIDCVTKWHDGIDLNIEGTTHRRREQSFLRNYLFAGKNYAVCGICGKTLPVNMLITSHIKKRSECDQQEKLDYKNVVMPMCSLGCDDLYEKGYIYVQEGEIKINKNKWLTEDLKEKVNDLAGRRCDYYNENTQKYFEAHREKFCI